MKDGVTVLVAEYEAAFSRLDSAAVSALWLMPAVISAGAQTTCFDDRATFARNVAALCAFYQRQGVARAAINLLERQELLPGCVRITTNNRLSSLAGAPVLDWRHHYILRQTGAQWRIAMAFADEEIAAWARRGTPIGS